MSGIYLASFKALHKDYDILYQDINGERDLGGDMMDYDLNNFDFVIASPPCNYYCRGNYRRNTSEYSLKTKHLLPDILHKLKNYDKPFIVENVRNPALFKSLGLFDLNYFVYIIGRHTYWTNIMFNPYVKQVFDNVAHISNSKRQGSDNVHNVVESFLDSCKLLNLI